MIDHRCGGSLRQRDRNDPEILRTDAREFPGGNWLLAGYSQMLKWRRTSAGEVYSRTAAAHFDRFRCAERRSGARFMVGSVRGF
jgi:hypothetical protein